MYTCKNKLFFQFLLTVSDYKFDYNYCYIINFEATDKQFEKIYNAITTFGTGRFVSYSIYKSNEIVWAYDSSKNIKTII